MISDRQAYAGKTPGQSTLAAGSELNRRPTRNGVLGKRVIIRRVLSRVFASLRGGPAPEMAKADLSIRLALLTPSAPRGKRTPPSRAAGLKVSCRRRSRSIQPVRISGTQTRCSICVTSRSNPAHRVCHSYNQFESYSQAATKIAEVGRD